MTDTQHTTPTPNPLSHVDDVMRKLGFGKEPGEGVAAILRNGAAQLGVPASEFTKALAPQPQQQHPAPHEQQAQAEGREQFTEQEEHESKGKHARSRL